MVNVRQKGRIAPAHAARQSPVGWTPLMTSSTEIPCWNDLLSSWAIASATGIVAVAALMIDGLLLGPYLDWRNSLAAQCKSQAAALDDARNALAREAQLRQMLAGMDASMTSDSSAELALRKAVRRSSGRPRDAMVNACYNSRRCTGSCASRS